jgi:hypothetical protein
MTEGEAVPACEPASTATSTEAPPVPSVAEVIRRGGRAGVARALVVGVGVIGMLCVGLGFFFLWIGSRELLVMSARVSGAPERTAGWLAGFYAVVLAHLLAGGALLGMGVVERTEINGLLLVPTSVIITAVVGAALAPLAYAPIASACGARGWIEPITRAVDIAGRDRLVTLAPLCASMGVFLLLPIFLVARGAFGLLNGDTEWTVVGALALAVWLAAVPASAAVLTVRYRRLERSGDAPTKLRRALAPILGAFAIGGAALAVSLAVAAATPLEAQPAWALSIPAGSGHAIELAQWLESPMERAPARAQVHDGTLYMNVPSDLHHWRVPYTRVGVRVGRGARCTVYPGTAGDAVVECLSPTDGAVRVSIDPEGRILGARVPVRIVARVGAAPITGLAVAVLVLAIALAWLGRVGASLRLLARPPFALEGTLRSEPTSDERPVFFSADGQVQVRVPPRCIDAAPGRSLAESEPAVLLAPVSVAAMTYRTAASSWPAGALLVVGPREGALARRIARARRIGFRIGLLGLLGLLWASGAILVSAVW